MLLLECGGSTKLCYFSNLIKDPKHLEFKFTHCWEILKNHPKWAQLESNQQVGDSPDEHGTPVSQVPDLNADTRDEIRPGAEGRGLGRNATKVKRKIANEKDPMWDEMMAGNSKTRALLEKQQFDFNMANQARMDMEKEKSDRKQHKYAMKQQKLDMKAAAINAEILNKDLANMTPFSKQYWTNMKQTVVDSTVERPRASRNLNFGDVGSGESNSSSQFSPNNLRAHSSNTQYVQETQEDVYRPNLNDLNVGNEGFGGGYDQWGHP
ncbi:hypothetical protein FRX31_013183 [Thalictrum thalictroides]|uniref:No apical meristem-associated C-terminal domain-containing protein n=1 Tax=Thalictrum thalictroides TaxID=46969 RepID=A0A7J6WKT4_THATH|nr:hypothetical protein FRX31_013183 [Thalictrum thalictroides]